MFLYGELATAQDRRERAAIRRGGPARPGRADGRRASWRPTTARARSTRARARCSSRHGRRWSPSTSTSRQRRPRAGASGSRPRCASRAAGSRASGRSASSCRRAAARRCRSTCTTTARCRCGSSWRRSRRDAPVAEAELVGLAPPRRRSTASRRDVPLRDFDPERHLIENALRSAPLMAQTRKKRRRKHRGTQAGNIETPGRTAAPRRRAARQRHRKTGTRARAPLKPPTWRARVQQGGRPAAAVFAVLFGARCSSNKGGGRASIVGDAVVRVRALPADRATAPTARLYRRRQAKAAGREVG